MWKSLSPFILLFSSLLFSSLFFGLWSMFVSSGEKSEVVREVPFVYFGIHSKTSNMEMFEYALILVVMLLYEAAVIPYRGGSFLSKKKRFDSVKLAALLPLPLAGSVFRQYSAFVHLPS